MPRWEADAERRLRDAAFDLFSGRGYDAVSVNAIADRAGLTRRTFFRYFTDKRDVLFPRSDDIGEAVARAIEAQDAGSGTHELVEVVLAVLTEAGEYITADRAAQRRRRDIIAASPELQERERTKLANTAAAIEAALEGRGVARAGLVAAVATELFRAAYEATLGEGDAASFGDQMDEGRLAVQSFAVGGAASA